MIALLAAATLIAAPAPQDTITPADMGRASTYAGMCSTLGWVSSREQVIAAAESYLTRNPGRSDAEVEAAMLPGTEAAKAEIQAAIAAYQSSRDGMTFKTFLRTQCDGVVRDMPGFLGRATDTDQRFEARMAEVLAGL